MFENIIGHKTILKLLKAAVERPASSYILYGEAHVGKRTVAQEFITALLRIEKWTMAAPDLVVLESEEGKVQISVEQVRGLRERMSLRPSVSPHMVAYIPQADRLNESGANALLKIVEEPPAGAVFVFVTEDIQKIPGTIRSRSVLLSFSIVPGADISAGLLARGCTADDMQRRAQIARGKPGIAIETPDIESKAGTLFVRAFLSARTDGERMAAVDQFAKACESQGEAVEEWREELAFAMQELSHHFESVPTETAAAGMAVLRSFGLIGSSLSPRIALDVGALFVGAGTCAFPQPVSSAFHRIGV